MCSSTWLYILPQTPQNRQSTTQLPLSPYLSPQPTTKREYTAMFVNYYTCGDELQQLPVTDFTYLISYDLNVLLK